jgi:hypothetical protein
MERSGKIRRDKFQAAQDRRVKGAGRIESKKGIRGRHKFQIENT